jgi:hypothetical protein
MDDLIGSFYRSSKVHSYASEYGMFEVTVAKMTTIHLHPNLLVAYAIMDWLFSA